jgi:hypothetical protein
MRGGLEGGIGTRRRPERKGLWRGMDAACDEPFGCEHRANRLRVERLSRVEGGKKEMEIMGDVVRVRQ